MKTEFNFTANGSDTLKVSTPELHFSIFGNFGGGTLQVASSSNGTDFVDIDNASFSSAGLINLDVAKNVTLKFTLTGATNPNLNIKILPKN